MESQYAINSLFPEELKNWMIQINEPAFRAKQLFHFFHKEKLSEIENKLSLCEFKKSKMKE